MVQHNLNNIEIMKFGGNPNLTRDVVVFENAEIRLSGDYLIVTVHSEDAMISQVFALSTILKYKITNNNKEI